MITKELIDRYLKNECSEDERRQVSEYLRSHPGELEQHLPEEEFAGAEAAPWEEQRSEEALQAIRKKLFERPAVIRRWRPALAAASVILVIGTVWFFGRGKGIPGSQNGQRNMMTPPLADVWEKRTNSTGNTLMLTLTDGSAVNLAPGSEIEYKKVFGKERLIRLEGEALFTIAKDKTRPFIVSSGDLSTTVLGTSFSVRSFAADPTIKVHLFTGKVSVRTTVKKDTAIGLLPGDELIYNKQRMTASVTSSMKKNMTVSTGRKGEKRLQPDWYMFGGQTLPQVFDQLSEYYGVEINYYPADVSNRYFTGKFSKTDSLETILKDISLLHDLSLKKLDGVYIFRKKKH